MRKYLELSRAPFFTAIITPALMAAALAFRETGAMNWTRFVLVMVALVAAHASANLFNDYFDYKLGADTSEVKRTPFSGGSPHLVEGRERESTFLALALASLAASAACGVAVMALLGGSFPPALGIGAAGVLLGVFYTAPPLKLAYRGLGEVAIFLAFGVLPVLGVYYVLAESFALDAFLASLPPAFLITGIILMNEFPDLETDREAGKRTLVVRLGSGNARYMYIALAATAYALVVVFSLLEVYGSWGFLGLAGLPLSLPASAILWRGHAWADKLVPAQAMTILAHLVTGIALAVGIWISA